MRTNEPDYSVPPIIIASPGDLIVDDEESLRTAVEMANSTGQLPYIELAAGIELTAPLPLLDNPRAGTATISGSGYTLDGSQVGSVLATGSDTTVVIERLTVTNDSGIKAASSR